MDEESRKILRFVLTAGRDLRLMARIEVRCCCQPEKLLGTVEIPGAKLPRELVVSRHKPDQVRYVGNPDVPVQPCSTVEFVIFPIELAVVDSYLFHAVKAEGYEGAELAQLLSRWDFQPCQ